MDEENILPSLYAKIGYLTVQLEIAVAHNEELRRLLDEYVNEKTDEKVD